jgi:hypothetical protein
MGIKRSEIGERQTRYIGNTYVFILGPYYQSQLYDMHDKLLTQLGPIWEAGCGGESGGRGGGEAEGDTPNRRSNDT